MKYTFTLRATVEETVEIEADDRDEAMELFEDTHGNKINLANSELSDIFTSVDPVDGKDGENLYNVSVTTQAVASINVRAKSAEKAVEQVQCLIDNGYLPASAYTDFSDEPESIVAQNEDDEDDTAEIVS